jgi:predicted amidophosphoribosyltransferase
MACGAERSAALCPGCAGRLRSAPARWIGGVLIRSGFVHEDPARAMVHRLKYHAAPAARLGALLVPLLPGDATALVPVPRVMLRRWHYGVDPALELARALSALTGVPVVEALAAPVWLPRRAGPAGRVRGRPGFERRRAAPAGAVLVDDVVTTGRTLVAAAQATDLTTAITLTSASGR